MKQTPAEGRVVEASRVCWRQLMMTSGEQRLPPTTGTNACLYLRAAIITASICHFNRLWRSPWAKRPHAHPAAARPAYISTSPSLHGRRSEQICQQRLWRNTSSPLTAGLRPLSHEAEKKKIHSGDRKAIYENKIEGRGRAGGGGWRVEGGG